MLQPLFKDDCTEIKKTMEQFDFDNPVPTQILASDLPRIFKLLGFKNINNHLPFIMLQSNYNADVVRINIDDFVQRIKEALAGRFSGDGALKNETFS